MSQVCVSFKKELITVKINKHSENRLLKYRKISVINMGCDKVT